MRGVAMARWAVAVVLALVAAGARADGGPAAIRADRIRADITYLASDALRGRASGTAGNEMAARYIAASFRRAGLKPLGTARQTDATAPMDRSGYFQPFTFTAGVAEGKGNRLTATIGGKTRAYRAGTDFEPSGVSASGRASGDVVFVGYGIVTSAAAKEPARDDFAGVDVKGRVVLVIAGSPGDNPHSPLYEYGGIRRKALTARGRGAVAIAVVLPLASDRPHMTPDESPTDAGLPIVVVTRRVASEWLAASGHDAEQALRGSGPAFDTGVRVGLATDVHKVTKTTANIAGLLEGRDPALKQQVVVIGAHMDHLGMGGPGSLDTSGKPAIHHGADDNASGTAGVMALADYFAALPASSRPKRSLLFICFSGEELGLLGSAHYVKQPLLPLASTAAMLNMDMVGRMKDDSLIVVGTGTSPAWDPLVEDLNGQAGFKLSRNESGFGASDQQSFYAVKVPVLFFFTGLHADYHKPSDTADKINAQGEARVVRFVAACAERIADAADRPAYQQLALPAEAAPARFHVSLGTIPDYAFEGEGVQLSGVRPGSPADKAGLKAGDVLIKFGGQSIRGVQEYAIALSDHKPGDVVQIVVKRGGKTITLKVTLEAGGR